MGAWGFQPLDNDTALDWMPAIVDMDINTLANTLSLLCNSINEHEAMLGAFIIDVYNNGLYSNELNLYGYDNWFKKLNKTLDNRMYRNACGDYSAICRLIDEGATTWGDKKERLNELKKLKSHIQNGTHKWDENEGRKKGRKRLKEYKVIWTQTLQETFIVRATSKDEAIEYVANNYDVNEIVNNDYEAEEVK